MNHYDVIIIGAGMSGLAAGIRLAYYDKNVCVLEKHSMPGGLNSFYRLDGRDFDVGLHAMTNFVPPTIRHAPLNKLLRQLRLKHEDFALCPQVQSSVRFPGKTLRFTNDFKFFESEVCEQFPAQADAFRRLVEHILAYNDVDLNATPISARKVLNDFLSDSLLIEMLFCPLMFYGSANEDDMEFGQFAIMFKSIFCEGFARPRIGVRQIVSTLIKKYKGCHGKLRMKSGVSRLRVDNGRVVAIELDNGETLTANTILSSAGTVETLALLNAVPEPGTRNPEPGRSPAPNPQPPTPAVPGRMTFMESISVLDKQPIDIGYRETITFFNNSERFHYNVPEEMVDPRSGVICCPNNFQYDEPLKEGMVRVTSIANFDRWIGLSESEYKARKQDWYERCVAEAVKFVPDFRPHVTYVDTFTPRTIHKFTGHANGAVYGAPEKWKNGRTPLSNLFLIGTDQGFLGIVGAMLSGISMANLHVLQGGRAE